MARGYGADIETILQLECVVQLQLEYGAIRDGVAAKLSVSVPVPVCVSISMSSRVCSLLRSRFADARSCNDAIAFEGNPASSRGTSLSSRPTMARAL